MDENVHHRTMQKRNAFYYFQYILRVWRTYGMIHYLVEICTESKNSEMSNGIQV